MSHHEVEPLDVVCNRPSRNIGFVELCNFFVSRVFMWAERQLYPCQTLSCTSAGENRTGYPSERRLSQPLLRKSAGWPNLHYTNLAGENMKKQPGRRFNDANHEGSSCHNNLAFRPIALEYSCDYI